MKIIICGAYGIGTHLAKMLSRNHEDITLIDEDDERLAQIGSDFDLLTAQASPSSIKALHEAGAEHADLFIAVTPEESLNITSCVLAKALGAKKTVAKISNSEYTAPRTAGFLYRTGCQFADLPREVGCRRHHQRTQNVVGSSAMGCAQWRIGDAGHQAEGDL